MAKKRFKILDGALDYLAFGNDATSVTLPANTPLRKFQEWRDKERALSYERLEQSLPGSIVTVAVNPFGVPLGVDNLARVPASERALGRQGIAATKTAANIEENDIDTAIGYNNFIPAKATISFPFNDPRSDEPTSQLTGIKYKRSNRTNITLPYGKKEGEELESTVRANIKGAVSAITNAKVSFKSEKM